MNDIIKRPPQWLLPEVQLTILAGMFANCQIACVKNFLIYRFIKQFHVDMREAKNESPEVYRSFNDFFIRQLKEECRPIADADIVSPVDGVITHYGSIQDGQLIQAKGHFYSVEELLVDPATAPLFEHGQFVTFYLSPKDYHRIHMPMDGILHKMIYVPGRLFSVQSKTTQEVPKLFARNERLVIFFDTPIGLITVVLIGAIIVGNIGTTWSGDIRREKNINYFDDLKSETISLKKGDELGYFKLGSTVILLLPGTQPIHYLSPSNGNNLVHYGQALARTGVPLT